MRNRYKKENGNGVDCFTAVTSETDPPLRCPYCGNSLELLGIEKIREGLKFCDIKTLWCAKCKKEMVDHDYYMG